MIVHNVAQNSPEWLQARLGIPTASEFHRILTPTGKLSAQAAGYMHRLLAEWWIGTPLEMEETRWMERGHDLEDQAVRAYEFETGENAETVGFITTDSGLVGCSPDRVVGDARLLEIKCPAPQTHVGYMLHGNVDGDYFPQLQGQLYVTGKHSVDIVSYCPGLPTVIIKVGRDEDYISKLDAALSSFVSGLLDARMTLENKYGKPERPIAPDPLDGMGFDVTEEDVYRMLGQRK